MYQPGDDASHLLIDDSPQFLCEVCEYVEVCEDGEQCERCQIAEARGIFL